MRFLWLIPMMLLALPVRAEQRDLDREIQRLAEGGGETLTTRERNQLLTRGWRDRRDTDGQPFVTQLVRPSDWVSDVNRGTVDFTPQVRNYSYLSVKVPDGTRLTGNFTQIEPQSDVFDRSPGFGHNLIFEDCNLANVKTYPDWTITDCLTAQIDRIRSGTDAGGDPVIQSEYVAQRSELVNPLRIKPAGRIAR